MSFSSFSDAGLLIVLFTLLALPIIALLVIAHYTKQRTSTYRWEPDQDYDVELRGESFMEPPFPVLKKRKRGKGSKD
jgi:hypothetical protein